MDLSETPLPMTAESMCKHLMFHVKHEAVKDLDYFREVLTEQNQYMNLVGPATIEHYWSRHVLDSAQLLHFAPEARTWADLGAGAGFPGLVLAILFKHQEEALARHIYLVDSLHKRCRFLQEVVDHLALPATVICDRVEAVDLRVDVLTARAFAPFPKLFGFAEGLFKKGAEGWFLKGESVDSELQEASKLWHFEAQCHTSISDPRGRIAHIRRLKRGRSHA